MVLGAPEFFPFYAFNILLRVENPKFQRGVVGTVLEIPDGDA